MNHRLSDLSPLLTEIASRLGLSNGAITLIIKRNNLIKKTLDGGRLVRGRFM